MNTDQLTEPLDVQTDGQGDGDGDSTTVDLKDDDRASELVEDEDSDSEYDNEGNEKEKKNSNSTKSATSGSSGADSYGKHGTTTNDEEKKKKEKKVDLSYVDSTETSKKLVDTGEGPFWLQVILFYKGFLLGFTIFFIFLFVRINQGDPRSSAQSITIGVSLFMVCLWITEQVPISVTSLLPIVLFPLCGILDTAQTTAQYANNIIFLLAGSFMLALAMEKWELHKRLVYHLLLRIGVGPKRILAGFMIATCFLSMWMSNATAALIVMPLIRSIAENAQGAATSGLSPKRIERAYLLAIAFSANIGGTITPIGSPANLMTISLMRKMFPASPDISFLVWMSYTFPMGIIFLGIAFTYISWRFFGLFGRNKPEHFAKLPKPTVDEYALYNSRGEDDPEPSSSAPVDPAQPTAFPDTTKIFTRKLAKLGPMKLAEKIVLTAFFLLVVLWIFRADFTLSSDSDCNSWYKCMPGWHRIFTNHFNMALFPLSTTSLFIEDSVPALLLVLPMFLIPAGDGKGSMILDWELTSKMPWNVLWLVGGGFALAEAFEQTGLAEWFATSLSGLSGAPQFAVLIVVVILFLFLTTISSNFAVAPIIVPVLGKLASSSGINPLYLCIPSTVAVSFAFLLPTSTTSNAVVFGTGKMPIKTMAKHGSIMTVAAILLLICCWGAWGQFAYRATAFESWAGTIANSTTITNF